MFPGGAPPSLFPDGLPRCIFRSTLVDLEIAVRFISMSCGFSSSTIWCCCRDKGLKDRSKPRRLASLPGHTDDLLRHGTGDEVRAALGVDRPFVDGDGLVVVWLCVLCACGSCCRCYAAVAVAVAVLRGLL